MEASLKKYKESQIQLNCLTVQKKLRECKIAEKLSDDLSQVLEQGALNFFGLRTLPELLNVRVSNGSEKKIH